MVRRTELKLHFSFDGINVLCAYNSRAGKGLLYADLLTPLLDEVSCLHCQTRLGVRDKICRIEGCYRLAYSRRRQLCERHNQRFLAGNPDTYLRPHAADYGGRLQKDRTCSLPDCDKPERAARYCSHHYINFLQRGDPRKENPDKIILPKGFQVAPTRW